jgi:hypothetical protein
MQKPKIGQCYRLFEGAVRSIEIIKVVSIENQIAYYKDLSNLDSKFVQKWDFVKFPDCLKYPLSSLEMELL